jgi:hypothetical protein
MRMTATGTKEEAFEKAENERQISGRTFGAAA